MTAAVVRRLRDGEAVDDDTFDRLYPAPIAQLAERHWTPVGVALRAAQLLAPTADARVLDIGAGPGKFCLIGALSTGAHFTGIEQRDYLVRAALEARARLGVHNAHFIHANLLDMDWSWYDGYYLFNPFAEHVLGGFDQTTRFHRASFGFYVREVRARLERTRPGTRVVTYHGFGDEPGPGFELISAEPAGTDELVLWVKTGEGWCGEGTPHAA
jgi:SAM-dependent methyltransferase